jgi:plasmid stabilization system protein ParE
MSLYLLTPQAEDDLFDIWSYIAQDSLDAANRVETQIYAACAFLASTPQAGHIRLDPPKLLPLCNRLRSCVRPAADHSHSSWCAGHPP